MKKFIVLFVALIVVFSAFYGCSQASESKMARVAAIDGNSVTLEILEYVYGGQQNSNGGQFVVGVLGTGSEGSKIVMGNGDLIYTIVENSGIVSPVVTDENGVVIGSTDLNFEFGTGSTVTWVYGTGDMSQLLPENSVKFESFGTVQGELAVVATVTVELDDETIGKLKVDDIVNVYYDFAGNISRVELAEIDHIENSSKEESSEKLEQDNKDESDESSDKKDEFVDESEDNDSSSDVENDDSNEEVE